MTNTSFGIVAESVNPYKKWLHSFWTPFVYSLILIYFISSIDNASNLVLIVTFSLVTVLIGLRAIRIHRILILEIEIKNSDFRIEYLRGNKTETLKCDMKDIRIVHDRAFGKTGMHKILLYLNGELVISQYESVYWPKEKIVDLFYDLKEMGVNITDYSLSYSKIRARQSKNK